MFVTVSGNVHNDVLHVGSGYFSSKDAMFKLKTIKTQIAMQEHHCLVRGTNPLEVLFDAGGGASAYIQPCRRHLANCTIRQRQSLDGMIQTAIRITILQFCTAPDMNLNALTFHNKNQEPKALPTLIFSLVCFYKTRFNSDAD